MAERKFTVIKSPVDKRDYKVSAIYKKKLFFPETLDYRSNMLPVRDQGDQGSCAAMAGAAMKEWQEQIDVSINGYMSPQFIYNNREGDGEGMHMRDLMKILNKLGDCTEVSFPYGSTYGKPPQSCYDEASNYVIKAYASITSVDELKTALYNNGPCIIAVPVYNMTERMWYKRPGDELLGGHGLLVVGYTNVGFIIRNSWSMDWGNNGYCIMPFADFNLAWESWTTIDDTSIIPDPNSEPKKSWWKRFWWIPTIIFVTSLVVTLVLTI